MHDIKFIRDNPKKFDDKMKNRNVKIRSDDLLKIDKKHRELISKHLFFDQLNI